VNATARAQWRGTLLDIWPGLVLAVVIAIASTFIAEHRGGPALLYALLMGMALNPIAAEGRAKPGVDFAARRVLRLGVALLGARITFEQVGALGWSTDFSSSAPWPRRSPSAWASRPCSGSDAASVFSPGARRPSAAPRPRSRSRRSFRAMSSPNASSSSLSPASLRYRRSR
jgi:hypothetical protein